MDSFNYLSEFNLNIEDISITVICDNPPDEIITERQKVASQKERSEPLHNHAYYEIFNVIKGALTLNFENTSLTLPANSSVIVPPLIYHVCSKAPDSIVEAVDFHFKPNKLTSSFPLYNTISQMLVPPYFATYNNQELTLLLQRLHFNVEAGNYPQISLLFHQFILSIFDTNMDKGNDNSRIYTTDSNMKRLYKIQQTISRNFSEDIRLETIADSLFLSTRQVNRLIKQYFGCTFKEYLTQMKMDVTSKLLITTNLPISEIYHRVGYNSLQSFYVAFQKHFSCTPIEYRVKNQKK